MVESYAKSAGYSEISVGLVFYSGSTFQRVTTITFLAADAAGGQLLLLISKPVGP